jgi:lipopolysaccharide assembly protein A
MLNRVRSIRRAQSGVLEGAGLFSTGFYHACLPWGVQARPASSTCQLELYSTDVCWSLQCATMDGVKALQYLQVLILVAILAYLGWFHLSNPFTVSFPLPILGAIPVSASMALLGGLLVGLLYALLLFAPHLLRRSNLIRRQNRKLRDLEAQVAKLQPLQVAPVIPDRMASNQQDQTPDQTLAQMREKGML